LYTGRSTQSGGPLNEQSSVGKLLERFERVFRSIDAPKTIVAVNDGSTDKTGDVLRRWQERLPLRVVDHGVNRGLGQAMRTGIASVADSAPADAVLVTMDADNSHDPALIPQMLEKHSAGADVVVASRYAPGGAEVGLPYHRHVFSRGANLVMALLFPLPGVKDFSCGYRLYRLAKLRDAMALYGSRFIEEDGFVCMAEILVKCRRVRIAAAEVPLVLRFDLREGASKMKVGRTIWRYLRFAAGQVRSGP